MHVVPVLHRVGVAPCGAIRYAIAPYGPTALPWLARAPSYTGIILLARRLTAFGRTASLISRALS